jgi:hypothetical protein
VTVGFGPGFESEQPIAIGAFDPAILAEIEEDARMAKRAAIAVASDPRFFDFDDFRCFGPHGSHL